MKPKFIKIVLISYLILFGVHFYGQEKEIEKDSTKIPKTKLTISDFSYNTFGSWEQHSSFQIKYNIDPSLSLELHGNYDTYILADVFKVPLIAKKYVSKRLHLFSGIEMETQRGVLKSKLWAKPQLKSKNGMGYDLNKNFQLQVEHDLFFNKSKTGIYSFPELFSLKGKLKF